MAAGKPVIATRVGSISTMLEEGVTGFVVDAGDTEQMAEALAFVLRHPEKAECLGLQARTVAVANHSAQVMVSEYLQVYRGCVTRRKPALQSIRTEGIQSNG
jgi:glycosyltransferase involved in cell wall biosynthesis